MKRLLTFYKYNAPGGRWRRNRGGHLPGPSVANCCGLLYNPCAAWVGWHYSPYNKRLCVNLVPFLTLWWVKPGGQLP